MADVQNVGDAKSDTSSDQGDNDYSPLGVDLKTLPPIMRGRVKALKNIQLDTIKAETEYYREVHQLDLKYQAKYDEINKKREQVVNGSYEPSGAEVEYPSDKEEDEEDGEVVLAKKVEELSLNPDFPADAKGIPKFWLHVLKNGNEEALMGLVEEHDEAVLENLTNITVALDLDNAGFTLSFHFKDNDFFTNKVLTKHYKLRHGPDSESPLEYDGPEIVSCTGCTIDWKAGKDVTATTVKVKTLSGKKGKSGVSPKKITKEVKADSFFNFFSPPAMKEDGELENDEDQATLAVDFDVGFAIKEKVIPRAVLYFTGDIFGSDDDEDFEDCEDEDDEDED